MTNREKWQGCILVVGVFVIAGFLATFFYQEWQREWRFEQARRAFDWNKVKHVPVPESEMLLGEAGVIEGLNTLRLVQSSLPEILLGDQTRFSYVTVVQARFGEESTYVVAFSKERPNALLDQYDGETNMVLFRWAESPYPTYYWLRRKDCGWESEGSTGGIGFGFSVGHRVSFRSLELEKTRPILFTKF